MNTFQTIYGDAPAMVRKAWYTGRQVGTTWFRPDQLRTVTDLRGVANYDLAIGDIVQFDPFTPQPNLQQPAAVAAVASQATLNAAKGFGPCVGAPNVGAANRAADGSAAVTAITTNWAVTPADTGADDTFFQPRLYVVSHVHPDVNIRSDPNNSNSSMAAQRDGGWIDVVPLGFARALFFKNTNILVPAGTPLGLYMPATSPAVSSVFTFGSGTANSGKPAFTNLLDANLDIASSTSVTVRRMLDILMRIPAIILESDATSGANGGMTASTTALKRVALGGLSYGI